MRVHELLKKPKLDYLKGFRMAGKQAKVVWSDVHIDGDRKRIRISRTDKFGQTVRRYVQPQTEVEIVS